MKKPTKIFISLLAAEILAIILQATAFADLCGSPCNLARFFNPFGTATLKCAYMTPQVCVRTPHPSFYFTVDLLVLTLIAFAVYSFVKSGKPAAAKINQ